MNIRKRDVLKGAGAGVTALAAPRIGWAEKTNKLVSTGTLSVLDPVVTGLRQTCNHAYLVFDTLCGIDTNWAAQPQMVEGHQVDQDGRTWTLKLRDGLRFHDKEPVLARDCRRQHSPLWRAYQLRRCTDRCDGGAVGSPMTAPCGFD